jgi:MFS family permease
MLCAFAFTVIFTSAYNGRSATYTAVPPLHITSFNILPLQAACNLGFDSPNSQSLLTSAVFVGMLLGAAAWGFLADKVGRTRALTASTAVVVVAGLASSVAPTQTVSYRQPVTRHSPFAQWHGVP